MESVNDFTIFGFMHKLKKLFSVFLIVMLLFGCIVPKSQEFKVDFIAALSCNVKIIQTNFYEKVLDAEMSVVNSVLNVFNAEEIQLTKNQNKKKDNDKDQTQPVNTSADNGIIIERNTNNQSGINVLKAKTLNVVYSYSKDLNILYGNLKINCNFLLNDIGILFFILFSILVVRIKDTIAVVLNNKYIISNRLAY